jgi:hypothetical protein
MPLLDLWKSRPSAFDDMNIEQIVAMAGDGNLRDQSLCSRKLRQYLSEIASTKLANYIERCLASNFAKSGMVLQDLVNEVGRRLDYSVANGRYQGTAREIGYDGIWSSPEGQTIVAEVKTTDAYRINLETIATYRDRLLANGDISTPCSMLIVVGRQDTGDLEAQVRGSKHAWDVRLVSADALMKLVRLKENADAPETGRKIRSVLAPMEYTRVDALVDVMFTAAADVEIPSPEPVSGPNTARQSTREQGQSWDIVGDVAVQAKRDQIIKSVSQRFSRPLVKKSRALWWDSDHLIRIACTISKRYADRSYPYWYAYHPQWDEFLREGTDSLFVLGCTDQPFTFALPWRVIHSVLDALNTTTTDRSTYWHLNVSEPRPEKFALQLPKRSSSLPLDEFRIPISG